MTNRREEIMLYLGYAKGDYIGKCKDCGEMVLNVDKRFWRCEKCAGILADYIESKIASARIDVAREIKNWLQGWTICDEMDHKIIIDYCNEIISNNESE